MNKAKLTAALLTALAAAPCARAGGTINDGFHNFRAECDSEYLPAWKDEIKAGRHWTRVSEKNLRDLQKVASSACPAYLSVRNEATAIRSFGRIKHLTTDKSPLVEKEGQRLVAFLETELAAQQAAFASSDIDFAATACGRHMRATQNRVKARLQKIQEATATLAAKCFQLNDKQDTQAQASSKAAIEAKVARQPSAAVNAMPKEKGTSDVTGLRKRN